MRSVRISPELDRRLKEAANVCGESVSEFIRRAAAERADATLSRITAADYDDVIGAVHVGGGQAERTGDAFYEILKEQAQRR
jgi:Protein of unknown function (DUF1778)